MTNNKTLEALAAVNSTLEDFGMDDPERSLDLEWGNVDIKVKHLPAIRAALMETHKGEDVCANCDGEGLVCEDHPEVPWMGGLGCCALGEGVPCSCQTPAPDVETITLSPAEMEELERQLDLPPKTIPALQKLLEDSHLCTAEVSEALETHDPKMNVKFKEDK